MIWFLSIFRAVRSSVPTEEHGNQPSSILRALGISIYPSWHCSVSCPAVDPFTPSTHLHSVLNNCYLLPNQQDWSHKNLEHLIVRVLFNLNCSLDCSMIQSYFSPSQSVPQPCGKKHNEKYFFIGIPSNGLICTDAYSSGVIYSCISDSVANKNIGS